MLAGRGRQCKQLSLIHISCTPLLVESCTRYGMVSRYRVQLSTSNGVQADSGVVDADVLHSLQLTRCLLYTSPGSISTFPT